MFETEVTRKVRYRVNISRGMKGSVSYEATVDGENLSMEEVLIESDKLVKQLELRYPVNEVLK